MKTFSTNKILIVLLFWKADRAQAMKLARLLADLEPSHSERADILFVSRFDCKHDVAAEKEVARKFNIYSYTSTRRGVGWPMGCNSMFFGAMEWVYHKIASGKIPHYKAILLLAADSAPLKRDWIEQIDSAWDLSNKSKDIYVAGAWIPGDHEHINGDCIMFSTKLNFLKWIALEVQDIKYRSGWDWALADQFKQWGWADFPFIKSLWRKSDFSQAEWDVFIGAGVSWIHGVKSMSLLDLARKNLL